MNRILPFLKWALIIIGGLSLLLLIVTGSFVAYQIGPGNKVLIDSVPSEDVCFVLNWCELGDERIDKVIHSYKTPQSFTGDHLEAYAISISHIDLSEITGDKGAYRKRWYRGDKLPKVVSDAVTFTDHCLASNKFSWFPEISQIRSDKIYVFPWSIYFRGINPTAAEIIFIRPEDKMIFYFSTKM